nr:C-type lectin domain family 17, member A-like isoform X1 [Procambarus clarkii]
MARLCYIVAMIMLPLASASGCNDPFIPIKGNCFYVHDTDMNWHDARDYCLSLSTDEYYSDLAQVHSCSQLGALWQHITLEYGRRAYWVGGNDLVIESNWYWATGGSVPMGNPYWYPGNPIVDETKNCLALQGNWGYFQDWYCEKEFFFVCEETSLSLAPINSI